MQSKQEFGISVCILLDTISVKPDEYEAHFKKKYEPYWIFYRNIIDCFFKVNCPDCVVISIIVLKILMDFHIPFWIKVEKKIKN